MLKTILEREMRSRNLSYRAVAEAIDVSHSTILRALRGDTVDIETIIKLAKFLNVRPSELVNTLDDGAPLADQIAVLLSHSRDFEQELRDAVERVKAGSISVDTLRDIVSYALYKLNSSGAQKQNVSRRRK